MAQCLIKHRDNFTFTHKPTLFSLPKYTYVFFGCGESDASILSFYFNVIVINPSPSDDGDDFQEILIVVHLLHKLKHVV
jgi:hypothetical protein